MKCEICDWHKSSEDHDYPLATKLIRYKDEILCSVCVDAITEALREFDDTDEPSDGSEDRSDMEGPHLLGVEDVEGNQSQSREEPGLHSGTEEDISSDEPDTFSQSQSSHSRARPVPDPRRRRRSGFQQCPC